MEINGTVNDGWAPVKEAFAANFANATELGASAFITHKGAPVVDIWAGARAPSGEPWEQDTIVNVYSTTKTMAALSLMMLVDRGLVDVHAPVATYWPEFAANGKEAITVAQVMSHQTGLAGFEPALTPTDLYDWDLCVENLAAMAPWWEPGTASGYHLVSHGYLIGEIVRRVDGRSIGTFFREEVAGPLGADFHIGFGPEHDDRCGELVPPDMGDRTGDMMALGADSVPVKAFLSCPLTGSEPRSRDWRAAEIPAAGGFGNARSVGRVHSALACGGTIDGVTLMKPETVAMITEEQCAGDDLVLMGPINFGLGFGLSGDAMPLPNSSCFYWGGWGGSIAIIDPENQLTATYVMNHMEADLLGDQRGGSVVLAAYGALLAGAG